MDMHRTRAQRSRGTNTRPLERSLSLALSRSFSRSLASSLAHAHSRSTLSLAVSHHLTRPFFLSPSRSAGLALVSIRLSSKGMLTYVYIHTYIYIYTRAHTDTLKQERNG